MADHAWLDRATCRVEKIPPAVFFPPRGDVRKFAAAKAVCARCPVTAECLADEVAAYGIRSGIRGGLGAQERKEPGMAKRRSA